jgi:predicted RNA methylase
LTFVLKYTGADVLFLETALRILQQQQAMGKGGGVIYSLHKKSTRDHLLKMLNNSGENVEAKVVATLIYNLKQSCKNADRVACIVFLKCVIIGLCVDKFHKQASMDIAVDLFRIVVNVVD